MYSLKESQLYVKKKIRIFCRNSVEPDLIHICMGQAYFHWFLYGPGQDNFHSGWDWEYQSVQTSRFYPTNIREREPFRVQNFLTVSVTGDRYCQQVILLHMHLFWGATGTDFIFMDQNIRPNWILAVEQLLESEDITTMDWSMYSHDLNICGMLAWLHLPKNTQLKQMLLEEWVLLPQQLLDNLVLSTEDSAINHFS